MDMSELRSLYDFDGPVVTVYASADQVRENAARLYALRWRDILADLEGQGVGPATRDALLAARGDPHQREGGTRVVVAVGEGGSARVPFARWLPGRSDVDVVAVGPLPHLLPLLDWAEGRIPHVIALVDRRGVDVLAYTDGPLPASGVSQDTTRPPWHKARTGGWAQRRYESRVEEHWKHGAKEDADRIVLAAHDIAAEVVILAGDPKELSLVREKLPVEVGTRVVVVEGSRARDGSDDHLAGRVMDVLAEQRTRRTASLLSEFEQYRRRATSVVGAASGTAPRSLGSVSAAGVGHPEGSGPADAGGGARSGGIALDAADGPRATVAALRLGQVSDLLLAEGVPAGAPAWIGPDLSEVALDPAELPAVDHPIRAGRVDALIRAALGTGAAVHSVPAEVPESPTERVGALLRYTLPTPG